MKTLLGLIKAIFQWLANRTAPEAVTRRHKKKVDAKVDEAIKASRHKNKDKVNRILRSRRLKILPFVLVFVLSGGCIAPKPAIMYVTQEQAVEPFTHNGVEGWFVPQPVFEKLLEAKIEMDNQGG